MSIIEIKKTLESALSRINENPESISHIKSWINGYTGKTIGFRIGNESFYMTFGSEGAKVHDGEPASFDLLIISGSEAALSLVSKDTSWRRFRESLRSGAMQIWGNMHEARIFLEIISRAHK